MRAELTAFERDANRHALHDLDPVAAGVLRGEERESATGAGTETGDLPVVLELVAVEIRGELHGLADTHLLELPFLEVRIDPHIVQRDDGHERRAGSDALPDLHGALGDIAGDRRGDGGS